MYSHRNGHRLHRRLHHWDRPEFRDVVTIMITDVDEKPSFSTGAESINVFLRTVPRSGMPPMATVTTKTRTDVTYTAMDPEGRTVSYADGTGRIQVPDQRQSSCPVLPGGQGPTSRPKASADGDNVYE